MPIEQGDVTCEGVTVRAQRATHPKYDGARVRLLTRRSDLSKRLRNRLTDSALNGRFRVDTIRYLEHG